MKKRNAPDENRLWGEGLRKILHLAPTKAIWVAFGGTDGDAQLD
jgi:phage gp37-like protein